MESAVLSVRDGLDESVDPSPTAVEALSSQTDEELLLEEIRIDDVSIDGMCGVY